MNADNLGIGMDGPHLLLTLAGLCSLIGLSRLAGHAGHYGAAGMAGVILAIAGVMLIIASKNLPSSISADSGWTVFYAGGLLLVIGSLLLGTGAMRNTAWHFGGPLLAIGVLVTVQMALLMLTGMTYLATVVLPILIGIAWIAVGYAIWSHRSEPVRQPAHSVG